MNDFRKLPPVGQSFWLDNLSRSMLEDRTLEARVRDQGVTGITSNPSTFSKSLAGGDLYDDRIRELSESGAEDEAIMESLMIEDVRKACDLLRPVYDASHGTDGYVSLEVSPWLARKTDETISRARHLWAEVKRGNCMIKIPGTVEGLPAIERCLADGININITLLFSVDRYVEVVERYRRALQARTASGLPSSHLFSVASFFLSRVDTLVDELLAHRGHTPDADTGTKPPLLGRTAISCAKQACQCGAQFFSGDPAWLEIAEKFPLRRQKLLWASTSTKNPRYDKLHYIRDLVGDDTISTMPEETLDALSHEETLDAATLEDDWDAALRTLDAVEGTGIELGMVSRRLEDEGIQKFIDSWDEALSTLRQKRKDLLRTGS